MDTHRIVKRLESAGFEPSQAEAVTEILRENQEVSLAELATKGDLAGVKSEIAAVRTEIRNEIRELELRMTIKLGGMIIALGGILIAVKFFG